MAKKKTPPEYGESEGPMMVACQWNRSSPIGPAEHDDGGSRPRSVSSLLILFNAIAKVLCVVKWLLVCCVESGGSRGRSKQNEVVKSYVRS